MCVWGGGGGGSVSTKHPWDESRNLRSMELRDEAYKVQFLFYSTIFLVEF